MRLAPSTISLLITAIMVAQPIWLAAAYSPFTARPAMQGLSLRIVGPKGDPNPVVNEGGQLQLVVVDSAGNRVSGMSFVSGSPEIAGIDPVTGMVRGVQRGFATVTARIGNQSVSAFVVVVKIESRSGRRVPGKTEIDTGGAIYISDPVNNVIMKRDSPASDMNVFAGQQGVRGKGDGQRLQSQFAGPVGLAIDNRAQGGIYVADTLNHGIRKIGFNDRVTTVLGNGAPGVNKEDVTPFDRAAFNGPQGVTLDKGGNLLIADTENHAIYLADLAKKEVRLLAGEPGVSGFANGRGRTARFNHPSGIISRSGSSFFTYDSKEGILVADTGNDRVRFITRDGEVTTLGRITKTGQMSEHLSAAMAEDDLVFNQPRSVSVDGAGNIYVVDDSGVKVVIEPVGQQRQILSLAQPDVSFKQAISVMVRGSVTFVLDAGAASEADAVKVVTVGEPEIFNLAERSIKTSAVGPAIPLEGGTEIVLNGRNFAPETLVILGDKVITDAKVESATSISFRAPSQNAPGRRTLSVQTRGGLAQREFVVVSKPLSELAEGEITTIAGGVPFLGDSGRATNASFNSVQSLSVDGAGNLLIVDTSNNRIRRLDRSGIITTIAGNGTAGFSGDGSPALGAGLNFPRSIAEDLSGNLFIADTANNRIRKIDAVTGIITTVAGNGTESFTGDGGPATGAGLAFPSSIAVDNSGNLYIADTENNRIRRVDGAGIISTVAGNGAIGFSGDGGPATSASLAFPLGIVLDEVGNLIIADSFNRRIRRIDKRGVITTIAGNGKNGFTGDGGPATAAGLDLPQGVTLDVSGNLLIADTENNRIRRVDGSSGIISTLAGNGTRGFGGDGGRAASASLNAPQGIAVDGVGNVLIADTENSRIRLVDRSGLIVTIAGNGTKGFNGDGSPAATAGLSSPTGMVLSDSGSLFIADAGNNRIRKIDSSSGLITTIAGNGAPSSGGDGGPAVNAGLNQPRSVALDRAGNLYIADTANHRIRRLDQSGVIATVAGDGTKGFGGDNGPAVKAILSSPAGVAIDRAGDLLIVDTGNNRIRRINAAGIITTIAGNGIDGFSGDGGPAVGAGLDSPESVTIDGAGNILIADSGNNVVRRVDTVTGIINTIAGNGYFIFSGDGGPASQAGLDPRGIVVDGTGNIFIADTVNHRIRQVNRSGIITTIAGSGTEGFTGDGGPAPNAELDLPHSVAVDAAGNLYILDTFNNAVRVVKGVAGGGARRVAVTGVSFVKPELIISGSGFGSSGARVNVNGLDVSSLVVRQEETKITLKGNKKKFGLKKGSNQVTVTAGGVTSNSFVFNF
jgi:sugar lactone lactonase YvrE